MGSSEAQGNVRRDLRLKLLFPGRERGCAGMAPLCPTGQDLKGVFG